MFKWGIGIKKIEIFSYLSKKFEANEISREEYRKGMQSFLSEITLFTQAQKNIQQRLR